jgi:hypothetical protein
MLCQSCEPSYVALRHAFTENGRNWIGLVWIRREDQARLMELDHELDDARRITAADAEAGYLEQWMKLCAHAVSKKHLWSVLTDSGAIAYPSLSTFYKHTGRRGVSRYWQEEFCLRNLHRIMQVLDVDDQRLTDGLALVSRLERRRAQLEDELVAGGHRLRGSTGRLDRNLPRAAGHSNSRRRATLMLCRSRVEDDRAGPQRPGAAAGSSRFE